jgi:hypothetical protein
VTDSERFRVRAKQCRDLAAGARDEVSRLELSEMARELEEEADRIDAENGGPTLEMPPAAQ